MPGMSGSAASALLATSATKAITPRTKMILVNSPANPTGRSATEAELRGLAELRFLNLFGTAVTDRGLAELHQLTKLEKLYLCLRDLSPQIEVPEPIRTRALRPISRMLELSAA